MKLNIGAGKKRIPGYTGVDTVSRGAADIIAPAHAIPLDSGSVEEILAIHVWEHFYLWDCPAVIEEWRRLLQPRGLLILELPNLIKCCQNLIDGRMKGGKDPDQLSYWGIYGDPREKDEWMHHRWGWTPASLAAFLHERGFDDIAEETTQWHMAGRDHRDMRITARKA